MSGTSAKFDEIFGKCARCRFTICVFIVIFFLSGKLEAVTRYVDHSAAGAGNGTSWIDAYTTLQGALAAIVSGDVLWVAEGPYTALDPGDFTISEDLHLYGGFATGGQADPSERDITGHPTILAKGGGVNWSIVTVMVAADVLFDGVSIIGGNSLLGGGGIYNAGILTVKNCTLSNNNAGAGGGGIFNFQNASLLVKKSIFSNNNTAVGGGGICNSMQSTLTVEDSSFLDNTAAGGGGGIFNFESVSLVLRNSTFSGNIATAVGGGGIYNSGALLTVENSTFSENRADLVGGGGIFNFGVPVVVSNCTFFNNNAMFGAQGLHYDLSGGAATVMNSIFWGGENQISVAPDVTVSYSVVQGGYAGSGNTGLNPALGPLADNGGPTKTHALFAGSPALDQGRPVGTLVAGGVFVPVNDQRGIARPQGTGVDIGAYELVFTPNPTPDPTPEPMPEPYPEPTPEPTPRPTPYPIQPVHHPIIPFSKTSSSENFVLTNPTPLIVSVPPNPTRESMKAAIRNALRVVLGFPDELADDFSENSLDKVDDTGQPYMSDAVRERLKEPLVDLEIPDGAPNPPLALFVARLTGVSSSGKGEDEGAIALAFFGPIPSVFVGKHAERLRVVKVLTSVSAMPFVQAFSMDELNDGHSAVVEVGRIGGGSVVKRFLGRTDAITNSCLVVIAIKDGGAFDLDGAKNDSVSDPAFLLEAEPTFSPSPVVSSRGGGGCTVGGSDIFFFLVLLLPAALLARSGTR